MRRVVLVVAVVLTVLLAGCTGVSVDGSGTDVDDTLDEQQEALEDETGDDDSINESDDGAETTGTDDSEDQTAVDGELEIHHIDVGQADSALLITPDGETILIDTGDWRQSGQGVIEYLDEHDIDRIDHLVATHAHADHIGGHDEIIEHYETERDGVGAAYDSGVAHTSATYERYLDAIEEHDVDLFEVQEGDELPIEDDQLTGLILNPPEGDSGSDLHYNSVTIVFGFGDFDYLTTGDVEADAEQRMVEQWTDELDVDAYQAGHHGSSTSSTESFMGEVEPSIAIISSDRDSQYGHPHDETLEIFDEFGVETYWTGVHEDIILTTDGQETSVETTTEFSNDPIDLLEEKPHDEDDDGSYSISVNTFEVAVSLVTH